MDPPKTNETVVSIQSLQTSSSGRALISREEMLAQAKRAIEGSTPSFYEDDEEESSDGSSIRIQSTSDCSSSKNNNNNNNNSSSKSKTSQNNMNDSVASIQSDWNTSNYSSSTFHTTSGNKITYRRIILNKTVGTLTLTEDRLVFKPQDKRDKDHIFSWHLDALQKHQVSASGTDVHLLKLISQSNPSKAAIMTFPDRTSLEHVHSNLSNKLQPLRKYRKVKETLVVTQRKLKDANKSIDEMQDTNQKLLVNCEAFAKKCKNLSHELQQQRRKELRHGYTNDKVVELQQQLLAIKPQVETLHNEKTAMAIGHEMDLVQYQEQIASLQQELREERKALAQERATTERLLEEREPMDQLRLEVQVVQYQEQIASLQQELQEERKALAQERATTEGLLEEREPMDQLRLEVQVLAKDLMNARKEAKEYKQTVEQQQIDFDVMIREVRRQRNNAFLEVAHLKKERDLLQQKINSYQEEQTQAAAAADKGKDPADPQLKQSADNNDKEEESLLGPDCLSASSLEETSQILISSKRTTTTPMDLYRCAILSRFLPVLLRARPPSAHPYPSWWSFSPVVRPWRGAAQTCAEALVTQKSWMNPSEQISSIPAAEDICRSGEIQLTPSDVLLSEMCPLSKDEPRPVPSDFCKDACYAGIMAAKSINQYPTQDPVQDSRLGELSACTLEQCGSEPSSLLAWSTYRSVANAVASKESVLMPSRWMQGLFLDPIMIEVHQWDQPKTQQLYLPDNTPVGVSVHQWDQPKTHQLYLPDNTAFGVPVHPWNRSKTHQLFLPNNTVVGVPKVPAEAASTVARCAPDLATQVGSTYSAITSAAVAPSATSVASSVPGIVAIPERCLR